MRAGTLVILTSVHDWDFILASVIVGSMVVGAIFGGLENVYLRSRLSFSRTISQFEVLAYVRI